MEDNENDNNIEANYSMSSASCFSSDEGDDDFDINTRKIDTLKDFNEGLHIVMKLKKALSEGSKTRGEMYSKPKQCKTCGKRFRRICAEYNEVHCYPIRKCI